MSDLITIINSKLSDKSELGDWYKDRLKTCVGCEFNSENKNPLNLRDKALVLANFGKPTCLACGCEIAAKASVETEDCGMVKKGLPSKWIRLDISKQTGFIIDNKSKDKAVLEYAGENSYNLNYRDLDYNENSQIDLKIFKKGLKIHQLQTKSACGCTVPVATFDDQNTINISITYNTTRQGDFTKSASLTITDKDGAVTKLFFNINGHVKTKQ